MPKKKQTPVPSAKRSKRRYWWRLLVGFILLFVLLLVSASAILSSPWGGQLICRTLNRWIPGEVALEAMQLGWRSGTQVRGLQWTDPNLGIDVKIRRLSAPSLLSLLTVGQLSPGKVEIVQPQVTINGQQMEMSFSRRSSTDTTAHTTSSRTPRSTP